MNILNYDYIIVGAGFAGSVLAERIASVLNKKVLLIDRRAHIGGNCYDEKATSGVLVHTYGPHLFHTDNENVYAYLSKFTSWHEYVHEVVASVEDKIVPIPFNINTLYEVFTDEKAQRLEEKLVELYGKNKKIPILELLKTEDVEIKKLGQYIYDKIFVNYTAKQWGKKPEEIDAAVTARVPVLTSKDNRYFTDKFQAVPKEGYTKLFEKMLDSENITVELNSDALDVLSVTGNRINYKGKSFEGKVVFTGMIDELFKDKFGVLPYRSINLEFETIAQEYYQDYAVVNYPNEHAYTRITEFKHIHPVKTTKTTILKEYPQEYERNKNTPYYPVFTDENQKRYEEYAAYAKTISNLFLVGRLAEYMYYDMDDIVEHALRVFEDEIKV
jgi:UDP-galactopyranose mutase